MEISGERQIGASRETVWQALNDPAVLKECIPGCESIEAVSSEEFHARMVTKIGPVKAKFESVIRLSDIHPPESYTISGEGKGGPAGFGKGGANVTLEAVSDSETLLRYDANLQVGGKLAQIGSRLVSGATRKLADQFFSNFSDQVGK